MKALVTYGSKMGGTAGLADMVAEALRERGVATHVEPAGTVGPPDGYDAVIVGGALYAGRWHRDARRFVKRHARDLQTRPVWLFSSGPLGDAQQKPDIPPVRQVARLATRIEARGHKTLGGRLPADPPGFMAGAMAKRMAGDWRDRDEVDRWVATIVAELAATDRTVRG